MRSTPRVSVSSMDTPSSLRLCPFVPAHSPPLSGWSPQSCICTTPVILGILIERKSDCGTRLDEVRIAGAAAQIRGEHVVQLLVVDERIFFRTFVASITKSGV